MTSDLQIGDVVQIDPEAESVRAGFRGCLMVVTDPKPWGAQGYVLIVTTLDEHPGQAFVRVKHEAMELVGRASWLLTHAPATDGQV